MDRSLGDHNGWRAAAVPRRRLTLAAGAAAAAVTLAGGAAGAAGASAAPVTTAPTSRAVVMLRGPHDVVTPGVRVVARFPHVGAELVRGSAASIAALRTDPYVAGVSPDEGVHVAGRDYGQSGLGVLAPRTLGGQAGKRDAGAGVTVAMLDTGLTDTAALNRASGRIVDGVDVSTLATDGQARTSGQFTDGYGHGTFLASIVAGGEVPGSGNRGIGVAPAARIVVVKVAGDDGSTTLSQVLAGFDWVAAHALRINVVNVALSVDRPTAPAYGPDPLTAAVEHVRAAGVVVVAAAGNTPGEVGDPGMDPQALTVGAADLSDAARVTDFSGSGTVAGVDKPDVVAVGAHVLGMMAPDSTIAREHPEGWASSGLFLGSGTSEATAVTSGAVALLLAAHPDLTPLQVKAALRSSARPMPDARAGAGLLDLPPGRSLPNVVNGGHGHGGSGGDGDDPTLTAAGEAGFDSSSWSAAAWQDGDWMDWLAAAWSGPAWDSSSSFSWSDSDWSSSSWSSSSWSSSSWSSSSWSSSSWSSSSWSSSSWSTYSWGNR